MGDDEKPHSLSLHVVPFKGGGVADMFIDGKLDASAGDPDYCAVIDRAIAWLREQRTSIRKDDTK